MRTPLSRRTFLKASAAAPLVLAAARTVARAAPAAGGYKKALICGKPDEKTLAAYKEAGFDGAETNAADVSPAEAEACRKIAEATGTAVHSVLRGWMAFNGKPEQVQETIGKTETALRAAKGYGADAILLVPCRIGGMKMPEAWEFDIEFDEKTGHLKRVAQGDNAPYADYIQAHDHATDTSREAIKRLIPVAEETGVVIAVENVWNNLWVKPALFAHFVRSFRSKWVQAYFDIGNHVKYAPPQEWIKALGPLIAKCHVKDFRLNPNGQGGTFVDIRDGSVDYPAVMKCLGEAGYHGWMTIEGSGGLSMEERSKRLDLIIAGK
jgi:hexulose-6-phosphate isomerase